MKHLIYLVLFVLFPVIANSTTYYVKESGAGNQSGTSWANASDDLQAMINKAQPGDAVFVAAGDYYPDKPSNHLHGSIDPYNRNNAFSLKKDVKVYGSFPADANDTEHSTIDSRFPDGWVLTTYLIGNPKRSNDWSDFVYHVVISAGDAGSALMDGFVIANGNADGSDKDEITVNGFAINNAMGAGMYNASSSPTLFRTIFIYNEAKYGGGIYNNNSAPTIESSSFSDNSVTYVGGGIYNFNSSPIIKNVDIIKNIAKTDGGGINNRTNSSPVLTNVTIKENKAHTGGGMYSSSQSAPELKYVDFRDNMASYGGAVYNYYAGKVSFYNVTVIGNVANEGSGGGISNRNTDPVLLNVLIVDNIAAISGGGIYNYSGSPMLVNVTMSKNNAAAGYGYGGAMKNDWGSRPKIYNSILWGNIGYLPGIYSENSSSVTYNHSLIEGSSNNEGGSIDGSTNPLFVGVSDYSLQRNSPCIDKGDNSLYTNNGGNINSDTDLIRNSRLSGASIDMGAYEFQGFGTSISELKILPDIIGLEGKIQIKSVVSSEVSVFTLEGKQVYSCIMNSETEIVSVPQGIYIVSLNGVSRKAIVK